MWRGHSWMKRLSIMDSIASLFSFSDFQMKFVVKKTGAVAGFFVLLLSSAPVCATTFGPVPVVQQAENSQYFVHGEVVGSSWMEMEPRVNRPYTYWRIQVKDQQLGPALGELIIVRQPGGEIGDMGYNVAGTATFKGGEDVFVALRDTDQHPGIKEVVGLASGKYRVGKGPNGETIVINGLGIPVTGGHGEFLSPPEFTALLKRVAANESTDADRNVYVNRTSTHQHPQTEEETKREAEAMKTFSRQREAGHPRSEAHGIPAPTKSRAENSEPENEIQKRSLSSEEPNTGSSVGIWVLAGILLLALLGILALILRK